MVKNLRRLSALLYLFGTLPVAAATAITLQQTMSAVTAPVVLLVFALSSVLGLASLLNQLKDMTPERLWMFVAAHMVSSWAGGAAAFVLAEWYDVNDWAEVGMIMFAAYASARSLDVMRDKLLAAIPGIVKTNGGK